MSSPRPEPGGWELRAAIDSIAESQARVEAKVDGLRTEMVGLREFEAYKSENHQRFAALDTRLTETVAEKAAAHGKLEQQIKETRTEVAADRDERAGWAGEMNAGVWLGLGTAVAAPLALKLVGVL